ncbi:MULTISPECIES: type I polyketide synthase [unclassified Legionella]|uniref:type I polyketide synthase n=1 Tax=unclassified Legionella TaxID=2622702 RepID=UPI001F5F3317|nr:MULTISPECIES: type I polyketide synthase [unclassified Legionella]MDI9818483.1 type I polyketide synthase [Legionella sp. PL877]
MNDLATELLLEKIFKHSESNSEKIALKFLEGNYKNSQQLTYKELKQKILYLRNKIQQFNIDKYGKINQQKPILLLFESSLEYIVAFLSVLYTGNIAVTAYPPRQTRHLQRLLKIIEDSKVEIILSTSKVRSYCETNDFQFPVQANLVCIDELDSEDDSALIPHNNQPEDIAFLQYTSGSTGAPKGVIVTHQNIVTNLNLLIEYMGIDSVSTCVSWLPIFHDMGLIGNTLLPLYSGGTCVFMAPLTFLKNPFFWLQKLSEEKGTYTMAPNFSYDLAAQALEKKDLSSFNLDFSTVHHLINGAEPVKPKTIRRIENLLSSYGLKQGAMKAGYGMAETTLVISIHTDSSRFLPVSKDKLSSGFGLSHHDLTDMTEVVRCGQVSEQYRLRIVDPDSRRLLPKHAIGEIWLHGNSVTAGYYRNTEKTNEIFNAFTIDTEEGPFLRTGDLGFIDPQGYLVVCGRVKDLIIINGRNLFPQDIEAACYNTHPELIKDGAAAFSIVGEGSEECVIVAEVNHRLKKDDYQDVLSKIKKSVFDASDIIPYDILLIPPKKLLKTSSGKVQRSACKQTYLHGEFDYLARLREPENFNPVIQHTEVSQHDDQIASWLKCWIAENSDVSYDSIDEHRAFSEYGFNSVKLVSMISGLEQFTKQPLEPWLAWEFPSIYALSQKLASHLSTQATQTIRNYEPIAVIGMDCRIPGAKQKNLVGIEEFWNFLQQEEDSIQPIPPDRWDNRPYFDPNPEKKGTMYSSSGSFLTDIKRFDAKFFNISPREAEYLDPQQRLALMVTWNALEDAGIPLQEIKDSKTGIYLGISTHDYDTLIQKQVPIEELTTYQATGTSFSTAAGRIAYFLGTQGPCMAIDTACSSSLVSIHQASRALQDGECSLAIAGGVNLILSPEGNIIFCKSGMLSPKNRCSTFDIEADGYVRGEGCGIVILKKLTDALRDGNKVYAVIHGSVVNQDGASNGLTAPNLSAQADVMKSAIHLAELKPEQITHVEAHGTGTALGDPIEWESIRRAYALERTTPLYITSLKTRIGHLEAAAGVASFIKTVLAIKQGQIPSHLHLKQFNPNIKKQDNMVVPNQPVQWSDKARYAGVSSFGFSGTNAHLIVGQSPRKESKTHEKMTRSHHLWVISARDPETLNNYLKIYRQFSYKQSDSNFAAICHQALTKRTHFPYRSFIVAKDGNEWATALDQQDWQQGKIEDQNKLAWLFTGQGCLQPNLAAELYNTLPEFAFIVEQCCKITEGLLDYDLREVLLNTPKEININHTLYAQPALFVYEYALARWFLSLGLRPTLLLGHSLGEYVAACIAEIMTLEECLRLVCIRAKLIASLPENGAMLAITLESEKVTELIRPFDSLVIAANNGPQQTVVSGSYDAIDACQSYCQEHGLHCKKLATSHAFHSPLMTPMIDAFYQEAMKISYSAPKMAVISNITGEELGAKQVNAKYWCEHLMHTVEFHQGLKKLAEQGIVICQEIGPKPVLIPQAQATHDFVTIPSIHNPNEPWPTLLEALGNFYLRGFFIKWEIFSTHQTDTEISLPKYPFKGKEYWLPTIADNQQSPDNTWKKYLYRIGWKQLDWLPVQSAHRKEITVITHNQSKSFNRLLALLKLHYDKVDVLPINYENTNKIPSQLTTARKWVYLCEANEDEFLQEANFLYSLTQFLIKNAVEKPFVFLNHQNPSGSALLAMMKSIKKEYPQWPIRYIEGDLFAEASPAWVHALEDAKLINWAFHYESSQLFSQYILPLEPDLLSGYHKIYPENTYLVTGACGDIGQQLIEVLLDSGVKHVVAVGRQAKNKDWSSTIQAYLNKGAQIDYHRCDISKMDELQQLILTINQHFPPLGSVIHAAGITIDKPWIETKPSEFNEVIAAKALGALNLHRATANIPLKEFICISSIAGVLGNQGQAAYATANAFLDALSDLRKQENKPTLNLILGPVRNMGLFKKNEQQLTEYLESIGIAPITIKEVKNLFKMQAEENKILLSNFLVAPVGPVENRDITTISNSINDEDKLSDEKTCSADDILTLVQKILRISAEELSIHDNWFEVGMDSIMATQLAHKINLRCKAKVVSSKDIFNYASAEELARKIHHESESNNHNSTNETIPQLATNIPLSLQQQEIWNFIKKSTSETAYLIPMVIKIQGPLVIDKFQQAIIQVSERHDIFAYSFHEILNQVNQHIHPGCKVEPEFSESIDEREEAQFLTAPFDLAHPPLMRSKLVKLNQEEYKWLLVFHHLICDGHTVSAFIRDIFTIYEGKELENQPKQYREYVAWQWEHILYRLSSSLQDYWINRLQHVPLDVPLESLTHKTMEAGVISTTLPLTTLRQTLSILEKNKLSLSNYLLANLFQTLFNAFNRQQQGVVVFFSGREEGDFSAVYGDTSNDVIVISNKEDNWLQHTKNLQEQILSLSDKQYLRMPMFKENGLDMPTISFDFQRSFELNTVDTPLKLTTMKSGNVQNSLWGDEPRLLSFKVLLTADELIISLKYRRDKISDILAQNLLDHWLVHMTYQNSEEKRVVSEGTDDLNSQDASILQQNLWKLFKNHPTGMPYYIPILKTVPANLNVEQLNKAINVCIRKIPALRTCFIEQGKTLKLVLGKPATFSLQRINTSNLYNTIGELFLESISIQEAPLLKGYLIYQEEENPILFIKIHHLICDGISAELLFHEIESHYLNNKLTPYEQKQDDDYLRIYSLSHANYQTQMENYQNYLSGLHFTHSENHLIKQQEQYFGGLIYKKLTAEHSKKITTFCQQQKISPYALYLHLFCKILSDVLNKDKIYISVVKSNRAQLNYPDMIGYYADNIPLLVSINPEIDFIRQLQAIQTQILDVIQRFQNPLFDEDLKKINYLQPEFIFNQYSLGKESKLFRSADYILENLLKKENQVALWNYSCPERINFIVRSSPQGDALGLIYNQGLISPNEINSILQQIIKELCQSLSI